MAGPEPAVQELPPVAAPQAGPALTVKTFQEVDSGLAKKYEGWQEQQRAAATLKCMKAEKEEQFRHVKDEGAFRTQAGKDAMTRCFKTVVDRHRKCEQSRNQILLGTEPHSD